MKIFISFCILFLLCTINVIAQDSRQKEEILNARKEEAGKENRLKEREKMSSAERGRQSNFEIYPTEIMTWGKGFSNGLAKISVNGKAGFINTKGEIIIQPKLKDAGRFSENLAPFENDDGKWGYINSNGETAIKPRFDWAISFSEGLALIQVGELWGFIDRSGKIIIEPKFENAESFSEGFAVVGYYDKDYVWNNPKRPNGKSRENFIDREGKFRFPSGFDGISRNFDGGMALVSRYIDDDRAISEDYFIDLEGNELWKWDSNLTWFSEDLIIVTVSYDKETKREKFSFLDRTGKRVTEKTFDYLSEFSEGLSAASKGNKSGFIDKTGKFVIEPKFDSTDSFSEGLAGASEQSGKYGYLDKSGKWVIKPQFDWVGSFQEGFALVASGGKTGRSDKTGYIDRTGNYIWKPTK